MRQLVKPKKGLLLLLTAIVFMVGAGRVIIAYSESFYSASQGKAVYTDMVKLYGNRGFGELIWPYSDDPAIRKPTAEGPARFPLGHLYTEDGQAAPNGVMEYPPGIAYWAYGTAWATHWLSGSPDLAERKAMTPNTWEYNGNPTLLRESLLFTGVNAVGLLLCQLLVVGLLAQIARKRFWELLPLALSPTVFFTGVINWDGLAVATVALSAWAWHREKPKAAAAWLGLGAAIKLYPLFVLGALVVILLRRKQAKDLWKLAAAAALPFIALNLIAFLSGPPEWKLFWEFNQERPADLGSVWLAAKLVGVPTMSTSALSLVTEVLFLLACGGILWLGLKAKREPTFAQLALLIVGAFLLTSKVYSPQYVLWLLPLAVMAAPDWRAQLPWQMTEVVYFLAVWPYLLDLNLHDGEASLGIVVIYVSAILFRLLGQGVLFSQVAREVWRGEGKPLDRPEETASTSV